MADDSDITPSRPSLADAIDLLDLVRSSEEGATLAAKTPKSPEPLPAPAADFVDVGDDAVEMPPSLPPQRVATPSMPPSMPPIPATARSPSDSAREGAKKPFHLPSRPRAPEPTQAGMSPVLSIALFAALAIGVLYTIIALPSSGAKPAELQLDGSAE